MIFARIREKCPNFALKLLCNNPVFREHPPRVRVSRQLPFSTVAGEGLSEKEFKDFENQKSSELLNKRFNTYKSEATCTRKVFTEDSKVVLGPPTYTIFSREVCLTLRVRKDELTGDNTLVFSGMTRLKDGSNGFNKNSRVSSVLQLDSLEKLNQTLKTESPNPVAFEGLDGGTVVVTNKKDLLSIKLYPSLIPGLNLSPGMLPNLNQKGKSHIDFTGSANEHALVSHALDEITVSV